MEFPDGPKRSYEPRVTFWLRNLTKEQKNSLRTVTFILRQLESRVRAAGSIRKAAVQLGVSKTFLSAVLRGQKPPGYRLARAVGFVPKVLYLRVLSNGSPSDFPSSFKDPSIPKTEPELTSG